MTRGQSILTALIAQGVCTYDDLERHTGFERNSLRWDCTALKSAGYIKQTEDSSRNEMAWAITPKGRRHHEEESKRPEVQEAPSKPKKQPSETPAAGGANNSRSRASAKPVGQARPRAEGKAKVIEAAKRDKTPAAPASDHKDRITYDLAIAAAVNLVEERHKFAQWVASLIGGTPPANLAECQQLLGTLLDGLAEKIERRSAA